MRSLLTRLSQQLGLTRQRFLPVFTVGMAMWAVSAVGVAVRAVNENEPVWRAVAASLPPLVFWLTLMPLILWLAIVFPFRQGERGRSIIAHAIAAGLLATLYSEVMMLLQTGWLPILGKPGMDMHSARGVRFQFGLLTYSFLLSWAYVHESFLRMREKEVAAARLEGLLAQEHLRALKAQLQPHFLFNTLHAITVLIRRDATAAIGTVTRLSDLLRLLLADGDTQEAPLEHELRFLRLYLEIEQTRFRERLAVKWEIAPEVRGAAVPTFILQPLVENALKHGVEPRVEGGHVGIAALREDDTLILRVSDDGPGFGNGSSREGVGIGLSSVRGRLMHLYNGGHRFSVHSGLGAGTHIEIAIPFRQHPAWKPTDGAA